MKNTNNKKIRIIIEYDKDKLWKVFTQGIVIKQCLIKNKEIPLGLLKDFFDNFQQYDPVQELRRNIISIIEGCYDDLKKIGYDFSITKYNCVPIIDPYYSPLTRGRRIKEIQRKRHNLNLESLLKECWDKILSIDALELLAMDDVKKIDIIYNQVSSYNYKLGNKKLTYYKVCVITGKIGTYLGINKTMKDYGRESGYPHYLFEQVRNALARILPQKST
jgi:hypothetical protein